MFDFDFGELAIKNRNALGNIITKHMINRISLKEKGASTLGGRKIWFDSSVNRLNDDGRGTYLGEFQGEDQILVILKNGDFRLSNFDLSSHFEEQILIIEQFDPSKVYALVLHDADQGFYYLKRFQIDPDIPENKLQSLIGENAESKLILLSNALLPMVKLSFTGKQKDREPEIIHVAGFIGLKSFRAKGKRLTTYEVESIEELEPLEPSEDLLQDYYGEDYKTTLWMEDEEEEPEEEPEEEEPKKIDPGGQFSLEW